MLKRFSAKQYKNVEADGLELARVTVLVGPNNGGKSNLIEAMRFYSEAYGGGPDAGNLIPLLERRGYGDVLKRGVTPPSEVGLRWEHVIDDSRHTVHDLAFRVGLPEQFPAGFNITRNDRRSEDTASDRFFRCYFHASSMKYTVDFRGISGKPAQSIVIPSMPGSFCIDSSIQSMKNLRRFASISAAMEQAVNTLIDIRNAKSSSSSAKLIIPNTSNVVSKDSSDPPDGTNVILEDLERFQIELFPRGVESYHRGTQLLPQGLAGSAKRNLTVLQLDASGSELVNVLSNLDRRHKDFEAAYQERLTQAMPGLERIKIEDVSDLHKALRVRLDGQWFRLDELSDGTLKMLALALLFFTPEKTSMLTIDEPELNLHPAWLRVVSGWMLAATGPEQVIASTHSPDLLDGLTEGFRNGDVALIVCDAKRGFRNVRVSDLDSFFRDGWELGDLYRVGEPQLGGWPW